MQASERAAVELKLAKLSDDMLDVQSNVEEMHKAVKQLPGRLADNGSGGGAGEDVSFEKKGPGLGIVSVRRNQARGAAYISGRHIRHTYKAHINQARCAAYTCVCVCVCLHVCVCVCISRSLALSLSLALWPRSHYQLQVGEAGSPVSGDRESDRWPRPGRYLRNRRL